MVSINNVSSNSFALSALRKINSDLATTQNRIATGLKVASASDDASVWSAATKIRSEVSSNEALATGINGVKAAADVAVAGLDTVNDLLSKMSEKLTAAKANPPSDYTAITAEITELQNQIKSVIGSSSSGSINLLSATTAKSVTVGSKADGSAVSATLAAEEILDTSTKLTEATTAPSGALDSSTLATLLTSVTGAQTEVTSRTTEIAGFSDSLETHTDFLNKINDIRNSALSSLVDADMEEEAAKVSALQVKQQLAYQALSIGNASSQNVLRLFQ